MARILLAAAIFDRPEYDTQERHRGLKELAKLADLEHYTGELTADKVDGVLGVIANSVPIHDEFYANGEDLRIIARWGVGFENVNLPAANKCGVYVTVSPVHMATVAEYALAQWLATLKRVYTLNQLSHSGDYSLIRTYEASGSTLGLYGFGRIGQEMGRRARPLLGEEGRLLIYDIRPDIGELAAEFGGEAVDDPRALFEQCDAISLHVAGADPIVNYDLLCAMKPHASLINPSRGNLVVDEDVNRAIREEKLFYYVVDDPTDGPRAIHKGHPRIICTNHNAGISVESTARLDHYTFDQVTDAIEGREPPDILNGEVLEHPRVKGFLAG